MDSLPKFMISRLEAKTLRGETNWIKLDEKEYKLQFKNCSIVLEFIRPSTKLDHIVFSVVDRKNNTIVEISAYEESEDWTELYKLYRAITVQKSQQTNEIFTEITTALQSNDIIGEI